MRMARGAMQGPRLLPVAIVLTALATSLFAASSAEAARSEFFGITQGTERLDDQDLQGMAAAKVRTERFQLKWSSVQRTEGTFTWNATDTFVGSLASHGIRPVPFVWGSPTWVAADPARPPLDSSANELAWQKFLR